MATTIAPATSTWQDAVLHSGPEVTRSQSTSAASRDQWRSRKTKNKNKDKDMDGALGNRVHDIPEWRKKHVCHPATHPRNFFTRIRNWLGRKNGGRTPWSVTAFCATFRTFITQFLHKEIWKGDIPENLGSPEIHARIDSMQQK